jgi:hypothetical protein
MHVQCDTLVDKREQKRREGKERIGSTITRIESSVGIEM